MSATSSTSSAASAPQLVHYSYPRLAPRSDRHRVRVNGEEVFVWRTSVADFACVSFAGRIAVDVETPKRMIPPTAATPQRAAGANVGTAQRPSALEPVAVRPLSRGVEATRGEDGAVRFELDAPANLSVETGEAMPLFFFANPLESDVPSPDDPRVHYFRGGQVYEVGELWLGEGETLYIEGGAVVRGCVRATNARGVRIAGRGVIDGSYYAGDRGTRTVLFQHCRDARIEDVIIVEPTTWIVDLRWCRNVLVRNTKEIGRVVGSDGVDIVSCRDVEVAGCFIRNNDDCVVIKAVAPREGDLPAEVAAGLDLDVDNILVRDCVFVNDRAGNALEIGFELRTETVGNIVFRNCDILSVHGHGAALSIHNGDQATVRDVLYEDIRIEHCYDKCVDFRVVDSRWSRGTGRGHIRNVRLKNVRWTPTIHNSGYTVSLIGGWDADHRVEGVVFEDFYVGDKKALGPDDLDLHTRHASGIEFC